MGKLFHFGIMTGLSNISFIERPLMKDIIDIEQNKVCCTSHLVHPPPVFYWRFHESYNCTTEKKCAYQGKWLNASGPDFEVATITNTFTIGR